MSPEREDRSFPWPMKVVDANDAEDGLREVEAINEDAAAQIGQWQNAAIHLYSGDPSLLARFRGVVVSVINEDGDPEDIELSTDHRQLMDAEPEFRDAWHDGELSG